MKLKDCFSPLIKIMLTWRAIDAYAKQNLKTEFYHPLLFHSRIPFRSIVLTAWMHPRWDFQHKLANPPSKAMSLFFGRQLQVERNKNIEESTTEKNGSVAIQKMEIFFFCGRFTYSSRCDKIWDPWGAKPNRKKESRLRWEYNAFMAGYQNRSSCK